MIHYRVNFYSELFIISIFIFPCIASGDDISPSLSKDVVSDLYLKYKEAVSDKNDVSSRRLFKNHKEYEIHVKRLKEVNGFKVHNLLIKEYLKTKSNPLIYINNPVESKIPKAYLTLDEFKYILTERIMKEREQIINRNKKKNLIHIPIVDTIQQYNNVNFNKSFINNKTLRININNQKIVVTKKESKSKEMNPKTVEPRTPKIDSTSYLRTGREKISDDIRSPRKEILNRNVDIDKELTPTKVENLMEKQETAATYATDKITDVYTDSTESNTTIVDSTISLSVGHENLTDHFENSKEITNEIVDIKKQLVATKAGNVSKADETTITELYYFITVTDSQYNDTNLFEDKAVETTDLMKNEVTLSQKSESTNEIKKKVGPRRKSTTKLSKRTETIKKPKKSTLGRPLVFMGNQ